MEKERAQLTAAIFNNEKEAEIFEWLVLMLPDYGTRPFNKRLETWLNKCAMQRFGTEVYKNWGMNGEDKTFSKVTFYMHKADYPTDTTRYELSVNYKGKNAQYDYETKKIEIREHSENERLFSVSDASELIERARSIVTNRIENVKKMRDNLAHLEELQRERGSLQSAIKTFNEKLSYAVADTMRVK